MRTAQEGGRLSPGPIVRNGQRPLWLPPQNAQPVAACLHSHTQPCTCPTAATQSQAATCPRWHPWPDFTSPPSNGLPSAALVPPASSREGARDPLGRSPSYHDGPHRPHTSSCPGLGTHHTHEPGHPEPRDDTGHQKEKQQSCRPAPPSCSRMWQCAQRPLGHAGRPRSTLNLWPLKEVTGKLSRRDAWPLHRLHHYSLGGLLAGGREERWGEEEKTAHNLTDTQVAFLAGARGQRALPGSAEI